MSEVPWRLRDLPWGEWIAAAPIVQIDAEGDDYHRRASEWLKDKPGQNAPLDDDEHDQLVNWISRYQVALIRTKVDSPSVPMDRLQLSAIGLLGSVAGPSIAAATGLTLLAPAAAIVGFGIGCIGLGYAVFAIQISLRKRRRATMIGEIDDALGKIAEIRIRPPRLPAPGQLDPTLDQIAATATKVPR